MYFSVLNCIIVNLHPFCVYPILDLMLMFNVIQCYFTTSQKVIEKSSRNANLRTYGSNLFRAVNLHQSTLQGQSENTQRAIREQSESNQVQNLNQSQLVGA